MLERHHSFLCLIGSFLMAGAIGGCSGSSTPTPESPEQEAGVVPRTQPDRRPRPGELTPEQYIRLGMPAHDRDWSKDDMTRAANVLADLAQEGYGNLPRYKSKRSGEVFARLTSTRNLDIYRNRTLPIEGRLPLAVEYLEGFNRINKLYLAAYLKRDGRDSELVEMTGAQLRTAVVFGDLIDEFVPTIDKDDPTYEVRMGGLEQMKRGVAQVVEGGLQMLPECANDPDDLARFVGYMQETFPRLVPRLPPGSRTETMIRLEKFQQD